MTHSPAESKFSGSPRQAGRLVTERPLSYDEAYLCPICRHGQISSLVLMDAFACNFCRHIFTANLIEQTVQVVDSSQPMSWRWNGRGWRLAYHQTDDLNLTVVIWLIGTALVILPSALVWLSAYTFPPLPGSPWAWFPMVWVGCTLLTHLLMVVWLLAEYYQFSPYISSKIHLQSLFNHR